MCLHRVARLNLGGYTEILASRPLVIIDGDVSRERSSDAETHDRVAIVGRIAFSGGRSQQPRRASFSVG